MNASIPVLIQKFKAGRYTLRANPTVLDDSISRLSPSAQEPARKFRDLLISDEYDLSKVYAACAAIMDGLPDDVIADLEQYKHEVVELFGLSVSSA